MKIEKWMARCICEKWNTLDHWMPQWCAWWSGFRIRVPLVATVSQSMAHRQRENSETQHTIPNSPKMLSGDAMLNASLWNLYR